MIFVTVGSDLPFDRLVREVDDWAREHQRTDVFAQIGATAWKPSFIPFQEFMEPHEFDRHLSAASVVIAHAGMGTILSALRLEKPILVLPRSAALREVRNDHQIATARYLSDMGKVSVAFDEVELRAALRHLDQLRPSGRIEAYAGNDLLNALRQFIHAP